MGFPVTPTPTQPAAPAQPLPLTFTVNPATDFQKITVGSSFSIGNYIENPWNCATVAAAERLQSYLKNKLGLNSTISYDWPQATWTDGSAWAQQGMVPYLDFQGNSDGTVQGPIGNSLHQNVGGLLMNAYFMNNTQKFDETCVNFFQPNN